MHDMKKAVKSALRALEELGTTSAVKIRLTDKKADIFSSKIGGIPYLPHDSLPASDESGNQLRLLIQINLSDVKNSLLPETGILQFWIAANDVLGLYDDFRVIYYENIDTTVTENEVAEKITPFEDYEKYYFPVKGEFGAEFETITETYPTSSIKYQRLFLQYYNAETGENIESMYNLPFEILDAVLYRLDSAYGHKIGGSSDFCQYDPREDTYINGNEILQYDFQLLQLSSDWEYINGKNYEKIMWGDSGVAHFFINSEKLKNKDFSDILYHADCC